MRVLYIDLDCCRPDHLGANGYPRPTSPNVDRIAAEGVSFTLCELLGLPVPAGWDGRSFAPALRAEPFEGRPFLVWDHGIYTFTRAVRTPGWLMIQVLHPGLYPYDAPVLLHDMNADRHQTANLASQRPEVTGELMALLAGWRQQQLQASGRPDPLEAMVATGLFLYYTPEQMYDRLERTGRGDRRPELRARLAKYHGGPRNV
jgi:choline-sulfatase